jgi:endonuclease I
MHDRHPGNNAMKHVTALAIAGILTSVTLAAFSAATRAGTTVSAAPHQPTAVTRAMVHVLAVAGHKRLPYTSGLTNTWTVLSLADADPKAPGHVVTLYCNRSVPAASGGNDYWECEHVWPRSLGGLDDKACDYAFTDLHHLFPTESGINESRGNKPYGYCTEPDCVPKSWEPTGPQNMMRGGDDGIWKVWPGRRGDVAPALFYMDVRYEGDVTVDGCREHDLVLTDDRRVISSTTSSPAYMGMLSDLCQWNREDPVDEGEQRRNDVIAQYQGNRNPLVDHPEWVADVWNDVPACRQPEATETVTSTVETPTPRGTMTYTETPAATSTATAPGTETSASTATPTGAGLPDLVITDILSYRSPGFASCWGPGPHDPVTEVQVKNQGNASAGHFMVRTEPLRDLVWEVSSLTAGEERWLELRPGWASAVIADADNEVVESNEANNRRDIEPTPNETEPPPCTATPSPTAADTVLPVTPTPTAGTDQPAGWSVFLPYVSAGHVLILPSVTPTTSSTPTVSATPTPSATPTATPTFIPTVGTAPPPPTDTPEPPEASPTPPRGYPYIAALECDGRDEYVRIAADGVDTTNLAGWSILSVVGDQTFSFPSYLLQPGAYVEVHSGPDAPDTGGNVFRWSRQYIWNSSDGDRARLRDPQGAVVDERGC